MEPLAEPHKIFHSTPKNGIFFTDSVGMSGVINLKKEINIASFLGSTSPLKKR
jgi:hypothetical protein